MSMSRNPMGWDARSQNQSKFQKLGSRSVRLLPFSVKAGSNESHYILTSTINTTTATLQDSKLKFGLTHFFQV